MERVRGRITIRDILLANDNWRRFQAEYPGRIRPVVAENVRRMLACRTPELGFHLYRCPEDGTERAVPHSCKSRMCSSCGKVASDNWASAVLNNTLDAGYHHLVLSVPWQFRVVTLANRKAMLNILFRSAAAAVMDWCQAYRGFTPGLLAVMHTFGADLKFHPHVHVIVTAGGLSLNGEGWVSLKPGFLMPHAGLKKRWRYQVTSRVNAAYRAGELTMPRLSSGAVLGLGSVMAAVLKLIWYVMIGTSLREIGFAVSYIGRYTRRPVIAEARIVRFDDRWVIFRYKDYASGGVQAIKKLPVFEFIGRLIRHIPDKHFRMVRHYGIFATRVRGEALPKARELLGQAEPAPVTPPTWRERWQQRTGKDPLACPRCGTQMVLVEKCFGPHAVLYARLGLAPGQRIDYRDTG
jgi:hypothetical protein